jgi:hypothetical protein
MGCAHKVFATEIDVALFEQAERGAGTACSSWRREPTRAARSPSKRRTNALAARSSIA